MPMDLQERALGVKHLPEPQKVCRIMAFWAITRDFGPVVLPIFGVQVVHLKLQPEFKVSAFWGLKV